jgi:hypothetical protein
MTPASLHDQFYSGGKMQKIIFGYILFFSMNSIACPDLRGVYDCEDNDFEWEVRIQQKLQNGITIYNLDTLGQQTELVTDGKIRILPEKEGEITALCANDTLITHIDNRGAEEYRVINITKLKLNKPDELHILTDKIEVNSGEYINENYHFVCTRDHSLK